MVAAFLETWSEPFVGLTAAVEEMTIILRSRLEVWMC